MRTFYDGPLRVDFDFTSRPISNNAIWKFQTAHSGLYAERRRPNPDGGSYQGARFPPQPERAGFHARISVNFVLEDVVAIPACLVVGWTLQITSQPQLCTPAGSPDTTAGIGSANVDPRPSMATGERYGRSHESINLLFLRSDLSTPRPERLPHPWMPVAIGGWRRDKL
jgi:hypothetical protein